MGKRSRKSALIQKAVNLAVERLGDHIICKTCGTNCERMGDLCSAPLDVACDGFKVYDAARNRALHDVGFFEKSAASRAGQLKPTRRQR